MVGCGRSQRNLVAERIKKWGRGKVSGKTRTSPQVIIKITLHFLAVECDSYYIITQNSDLSTFRKLKRKQEADYNCEQVLIWGIISLLLSCSAENDFILL